MLFNNKIKLSYKISKVLLWCETGKKCCFILKNSTDLWFERPCYYCRPPFVNSVYIFIYLLAIFFASPDDSFHPSVRVDINMSTLRMYCTLYKVHVYNVHVLKTFHVYRLRGL